MEPGPDHPISIEPNPDRVVQRSANAVWEYRSPYPAVDEIAGHVAFYPDRVDAITTDDQPSAAGSR